MKKKNFTFLLDILFVRKYKKQIFAANLAGMALILGYYYVQDVREERAIRRSLEASTD